MKKLLRSGCESFALFIEDVIPAQENQLEISNVESMHRDPRITKLLNSFPEVFPENLPSGLPPPRRFDHRITLVPGARPHTQSPYRLSAVEKEELFKVVNELLDSGYIRASKSPWGAPVLFARKKDGTYRFCVDYRMLNKQTIRNMFPIPSTEELMDRTHGSQVFSKLDLRSAYHQVRIDDEDIPKTAFTTPFGHYEYLVLPFGLCNGPATFQSLMNDLLGHLKFCIVYLDDILIFSKSEEEHQSHVQEVLSILKANSLYAKWQKCQFFQDSVPFLGHVVSNTGLSVDPEKVSAIDEWPEPTCVKELQQFLGLSNYYRRFCPGYAKIALPLTRLLRKDTVFDWSQNCQRSFQDLKRFLTNSPTLRIPDPYRPFRLQTDASGFAIGAVLMQEHSGRWHPVSYLSRKMNRAERNYPIQEQEMLALVYALKKWRHYLFGFEVHAYTDHESLRHWQKYRNLTGRKARWVEVLDEFPVIIHYEPGSSNIVADALSRRPDLGICNLSISAPTFCVDLTSHYAEDALFSKLITYFKDPSSEPDGSVISLIPRFTYDSRNGRLYYTYKKSYRLCIPRNKELLNQLLNEFHTPKHSAHPGCEKLYNKLRSCFYWPKMQRDIQNFIRRCDSCQRNKPSNRNQRGPLQPLDIPKAPWCSVSFDFIQSLPFSSGFDSIFVVVDRLTKMAHFIPNHSTDSATDVATLFMNRIFSLHGLPRNFVSDRDPKFTSLFWRELFRLLETKLSFSTAAHPESDGQTERMNAVLEVMLRHFVNSNLDNWSELLPSLEFAYNSSPQKSTGFSPFYLNYGYEPHTPASLALGTRSDDSQSRVEAVNAFASHMNGVIRAAQDAIQDSQIDQARYANRSRNLKKSFEVGQEVLLSTSNLKLHFQAKDKNKLQPLFIGPFRIVEKLSDVAYRLELPESMRVHDVFNVSMLREYHKPLVAPNTRPDPVVLPDGNEVFEVESLIRRRGQGSSTQYLVKWVGYPSYESTWEDRSSLMKEVPALVEEFDGRRLRD